MSVFNSRKFRVWLFTVGVVLFVYIIYGQFSETPEIRYDKIGGDEGISSEQGDGGGSNYGQVSGSLDIDTVEETRFVHRDSSKRIDRVFGFAKLLHKIGDEWEIEKPFMDFYREDLTCRITADRGIIQSGESIDISGSPKDATLTGNVVIHIEGTQGSEISESYIYLDRLDFISEKSQILSPGKIEFVSSDAWMTGRGLELVYNDDLNRLEYLTISRVDNLRLRTPGGEQSVVEGEGIAADSDGKGSAGLSSEEDISAGTSTVKADVKNTVVPKEQAKKSEFRYKCILSDNVVIDSPNQIILAEELNLENILFSDNGSKRKSENGSNARSENAKSVVSSTESGEAEERVIAGDRGIPEQSDANSIEIKGDAGVEFVCDKSVLDTIVKCENGLMVTAMDSKFSSRGYFDDFSRYKNYKDPNRRSTFAAKQISYDVVKGTINLESDSRCTFYNSDEHYDWVYNLSAPVVDIVLSQDQYSSGSGLSGLVDSMDAGGGIVQLDSSKWQYGELVGFAKLKSLKARYDGRNELFEAFGPNGLVAIDNSRDTRSISESTDNLLGMKKQCYAIVEGFELFRYDFAEEVIEIGGSESGMAINYFPVEEGQSNGQITIITSDVKVNMVEDSNGDLQIDQVSAKGGIALADARETSDLEFSGSYMLFDAGNELVSVFGEEGQPCMLNGSPFERINYNVRTKETSTSLAGVSSFELR
jgi:hypothetical protein